MQVADGSGSAVPRRRLGRDLRELRERTRLSQDDAATALACSRQKIWRIESGAVPVRPSDVKVLCNLYRAGPTTTRLLVALAVQTRGKGWWQAYADVLPGWFSRYVGLEAAASRLRCHQGETIPGLLQTRRYADLIYREHPGLTWAERERMVEVRLRRQEILDRRTPPSPRLDVVMSEMVLHRRIGGPDDMAEQLRHLHRMSMRDNITVRIIPLTAGPALAGSAGTFVLLDFPAGRDTAPETTTVYSEALTHASYLDRPDEICAYELAWDRLVGCALDEVRSRELLAGLTETGG